MFQDEGDWTSTEIVPSLQGLALEKHLRWENAFRELLKECNFSNVYLPTLMPLARFRSMLTGQNMLPPGPTFRDDQGVDWAMRSDMTAFSSQFVRGRLPHSTEPMRLGYSGKVFSYANERQRSGGFAASTGHGLKHPFMESYEFGAEVVAEAHAGYEAEVVDLLLRSAERFGYEDLVLVFGHTSILREVFAWADSKGIENGLGRLAIADAMKVADQSFLAQDKEFDWVVKNALQASGLEKFVEETARRHGAATCICDPLLVRPQDFYSGLTFELFVKVKGKALVRVGAGGRYDSLLKHYGLNRSAVGFKIGDPSITGSEVAAHGLSDRVRIAVPKGRLQNAIFSAFARVGIVPAIDPTLSRKLVLPSVCGFYEFLLVKNSDVPSYIERGAADIGVSGSDVLEEKFSEVFRPVTFSFGETRICLAGRPADAETVSKKGTLTIATKYARIAARELAKLGRECDIVPLQGSVELASVLGMSDAIVDLVETGKTLQENDLVVFQELTRTRVHLCTSRGFYYLRAQEIARWKELWLKDGLIK